MKKHVIDYKEYCRLVQHICREISLSNWQPDYVAGITRGGLLPAVMISHYLAVPMHTLKVSLRDDADNVSESNIWMAEDAFGYNMDPPKNILIVDDINDSGATLNWIMTDWQSSCLPHDVKWEKDIWNNNVRFAVVVDNLASKCSVGMDYYGMEINKEENNVWIDFPYEDWWLK
jgi:hypoxanthine phosphoribosyltransferase